MSAAVVEEQDMETLRADARDAVRRVRDKISRLDDDALDLLFREARSHYAWTDRSVSDDDLRALYDIVKFGPTSMNGSPARFIFVRTPEAKTRLLACLDPGNVPKAEAAPVTAIIAYNPEFWKDLAYLHAHNDMSYKFSGDPKKADSAAFRNATLQGAYLMIAARALGFDVGAMSGFSIPKVNEEFLSGTPWKANFLLNIGYADETALFQRLPRFKFDEACSII